MYKEHFKNQTEHFNPMRKHTPVELVFVCWMYVCVLKKKIVISLAI